MRDRLEHRWARRRLSAYFDDELAPAERIRLERHARHCADCGPLLRSLAVLLEALRGLPRPAQRSIAPSVVSHLRRASDGAPQARSI